MSGRSATDARIGQLVSQRLRTEPALTRSAVVGALGRRGLERAVRSGTLACILPGVYVEAARRDEHRVRCAAVEAWSGGRLLIGGSSALHLYHSRFPAPERVHAIAGPDHHPRAPAWIAVRRSVSPAWTSCPEGVRSLVAEDAVLDAWVRADARDRAAVLYEALWLRIAGPRRLMNAAARLSRLPDRRRFDQIMTDFTTGATSPSEVRARRDVFTGRAFRELEWQVSLVVRGRRRTADALHRRARVVVELDGAAFHTTRRQVARDRERDADFAAEGWLTVRFSFGDLRDRPDWCRRTLAAILERRHRA